MFRGNKTHRVAMTEKPDTGKPVSTRSANAGITAINIKILFRVYHDWVPAFAGMTEKGQE